MCGGCGCFEGEEYLIWVECVVDLQMMSLI